MNKCQKHYKKCNAYCCRGFWIRLTPAKENMLYYLYHLAPEDQKALQEKGYLRVWVTAPCKHFNAKTLKCDIYEKRPDFCKTWKCEFLEKQNI